MLASISSPPLRVTCPPLPFGRERYEIRERCIPNESKRSQLRGPEECRALDRGYADFRELFFRNCLEKAESVPTLQFWRQEGLKRARKSLNWPPSEPDAGLFLNFQTVSPGRW